MLRIGFMTLVALAMSVFSLASASSATATTPEFIPGAKNKFTGTSGASTLTTTGQSITCTADKSAGEIVSTDAVSNVVVTFTSCKAKKGSETCPIRSVGAAAETIVTNTLKGDLGTVAGAEAASGVGLLLEPGTGSTLSSLVAGTCVVETAISGKIAGEVNQVGKEQRTNSVVFAVAAGKQKIATIIVLGKVESPSLKAYGLSATEEATENLQFDEFVEVGVDPKVTVNPERVLDLGVAAGEARTETFTYKNNGPLNKWSPTIGATKLQESTANGATFTTTDACKGFTLNVGATCRVTIEIAVLVEGNYREEYSLNGGQWMAFEVR